MIYAVDGRIGVAIANVVANVNVLGLEFAGEVWRTFRGQFGRMKKLQPMNVLYAPRSVTAYVVHPVQISFEYF